MPSPFHHPPSLPSSLPAPMTVILRDTGSSGENHKVLAEMVRPCYGQR